MNDHAHHWVLDAAVGHPQVNAVCRHCGAERLFNLGHPQDMTNMAARWTGRTVMFESDPGRRLHRRKWKGAP